MARSVGLGTVAVWWTALVAATLCVGCGEEMQAGGGGAGASVVTGGGGAGGTGTGSDADDDGYDASIDCNDDDPAVNPGATEVCNGVDDDCDDEIDEGGVVATYYVDGDDDGWGVDDESTNIETCGTVDGYSMNAGDCDDDDDAVHPEATEIPGNGIDEDCSNGDAPCVNGTYQCDGTVALTCENGTWGTAVECAPNLCLPTLGCVVCTPGESTCVMGTAHTCASDGSGYIDYPCDPVMGSTCDTNSGTCTGPCAPQALGTSYIGCDFYPTVTQQLDSYNTAPTYRFAVAVSNTSTNAANVTVTRGTTTITTTVVAANSLAVIELPWVDALTKGTGPSALVAQGAYRLRTDQPVTVYQYNPLDANVTNDASLLLPANAWTGNYVVAASAHWSAYPGFYAVTAQQDGTVVTLTPSATGQLIQAGGGVAANGTGQVTLNAGDVLQVMTSSGGDPTGTRVTATKPVQVIGGHDCTDVPYNITACDHLEESMFPLETLVNEYIIAPPVQTPNASAEKAQIVRVIATEAGTTLTFTPDQGVATTLANAGDFVEVPMTTARFVVQSSKRVLVAQYMVGQSAGYGLSDPAMVLAVSPTQWRDNYLVHAPIGWSANYVDLIAVTGTAVSVDGTPVAGWTVVASSNYSVAHVLLSSATGGNHTVTANADVGVSVYGLQSYGSYWYPGGLDLVPMM